MTRNAIGVWQVAVLDVAAILWAVAGKTLLAVMLLPIRFLDDRMRIVAMRTANSAFCFDKAFALIEAIWVMIDFKMIRQIVVAVGFKVDHEIAERLAWLEAVIRLSELANETGALAHRLKVALVANSVLKFR